MRITLSAATCLNLVNITYNLMQLFKVPYGQHTLTTPTLFENIPHEQFSSERLG